MFNYFRRNDDVRVFLCCTRPYLRNVHYQSVKDYFKSVDLLWDSRYGYDVLKVVNWGKENAKKEESQRAAKFYAYLTKYKLT